MIDDDEQYQTLKWIYEREQEERCENLRQLELYKFVSIIECMFRIPVPLGW